MFAYPDQRGALSATSIDETNAELAVDGGLSWRACALCSWPSGNGYSHFWRWPLTMA